MLEEEWAQLSTLYLCPLRALLNNLYPRINKYADLVGRRAGLWHGDVGESARERIRDDPPDILLTTPESIEAMLISGKTQHERLFRNVRAVLVDEIHAFAGDDRGWHLLAVVERVQRLSRHPIQRIGLSATVGNGQEILSWLIRTSTGTRKVIEPEIVSRARVDVTVDFVGDLANAATVVSRLHRGEKRLVFVDSRARVEELAVELRDRSVETYVSHGSLGREERHAAEQAFAQSRNCVIVATSTLELGIDVGDLDRVIQIDTPPNVASFLQRLGRTGRRAGQVGNTLFLATREDTLVSTLGLLNCWERGYVEPLEPPPLPLHLLVQQLLALVLQEGDVGKRTWPEWYGRPFVLGEETGAYAEQLTASLLHRDFLFEDSGILGIGRRGEEVFGGRNFLDLMAVFSEPPMFKVLAGRTEIGQVPLRLFMLEAPDGHVLLLGGRDWHVLDVDWRRGVVQVEPAEKRGKIRWFSEGRNLSFAVCQGIKRVLAGKSFDRVELSSRARDRLDEVLAEFSWVTGQDATFAVRDSDGTERLWTFAGADVNVWLSLGLADLADQTVPGGLSIRLAENVDIEEVRVALDTLEPGGLSLSEQVARGAIDRLKFAEALPGELAERVVERRMRADDLVRKVSSWALERIVTVA
jgi:ATP-dependent Lhr-like helicase